METAVLHEQEKDPGGHIHKVPIFIDTHKFEVPEGNTTSETLRNLPSHPGRPGPVA